MKKASKVFLVGVVGFSFLDLGCATKPSAPNGNVGGSGGIGGSSCDGASLECGKKLLVITAKSCEENDQTDLNTRLSRTGGGIVVDNLNTECRDVCAYEFDANDGVSVLLEPCALDELNFCGCSVDLLLVVEDARPWDVYWRTTKEQQPTLLGTVESNGAGGYGGGG